MNQIIKKYFINQKVFGRHFNLLFKINILYNLFILNFGKIMVLNFLYK